MTDHQYATLKYQQLDAVVTITLDRPDAANGLNLELATELAHAAQQASVASAVKAVILTGSGTMFCAGGDIKSMLSFGDSMGAGLKGIADNLHRAMSTFARMDAPLINAVNGTAAGAGFVLSVCGDFVIAADNAKFTMAYTKIGLSPDGGSTFYLPRLIGLRKTQELMFTNRVLSAQDALDWGLVNVVAAPAEVMTEAQNIAQTFAQGSLSANSSVKKLLLESWGNGLETQMELEGRQIAANIESVDGKEGVTAFVEKRKPNFS